MDEKDPLVLINRAMKELATMDKYIEALHLIGIPVGEEISCISVNVDLILYEAKKAIIEETDEHFKQARNQTGSILKSLVDNITEEE